MDNEPFMNGSGGRPLDDEAVRYIPLWSFDEIAKNRPQCPNLSGVGWKVHRGACGRIKVRYGALWSMLARSLLQSRLSEKQLEVSHKLWCGKSRSQVRGKLIEMGEMKRSPHGRLVHGLLAKVQH